MLQRAKRSWARFKHAAPGHRFQERYRRHSPRRRRFQLRRSLNIVGGLAIIGAGLFLFATPGPGWIAVFIGLALVAGEVAPIARALDWCEVKARVLGRRAGSRWRRAPPGAKAAVVVLALGVVASGAYGVFRFVS